MQELKTHQENKVNVSKSESPATPSLNHINYIANIPPTTELLVELEIHKAPKAADD